MREVALKKLRAWGAQLTAARVWACSDCGSSYLRRDHFLSFLVLAFPAPMRAGRYKATIFCGVSKRLALPLRLRRNTPGRRDKARANDFLKLPARGRTRLRAGPFSV